MDPIWHPSHRHTLSYHDAACPGMFQCQGCGEDFDGPTFCCEICKFGLHKWCAQQPLVLNRHPLHPQHKLIMFVEDSRNAFICKECLLPFYGCLSYRCHQCDFKLHLSCAASTMSQPSQKDGNRSSKKVSTFKHSFHTDHDLILYDQVHERMRLVNNVCEWCEKPILSGKFYACLPCQFFLHEACTFEVPYTIQLPYFCDKYSLGHGGGFCFACRGQIRNCRFTWNRINLRHLHPRCTILLPSLMSEYHGQHNLTYFEKENYRGDFQCQKCRKFGSTSDNHSGFYRCPECNINFHLSCILPSTMEYKYHSCRNPLVLKNPIKDDFYYEYYCDICETKRYPNHCVYSCQDCNFFDAHIECALNQIRDEQPYEPASIIQSLKVKPKAVLKDKIHDQEHQMKHPNHPHLLSLDDIVNVKPLYRFCRGCKLKVFGQTKAFICMDCKDYCLHEECAKLSMSSYQLLESPLHPLHRLSLNFEHSQGKRFICDACGEIKESDCFNYQCQECEFVMEFKCVFMSEPISQGSKKLESPFHFFHRHMLYFGNYKNKQRFYCSICLHPVLGLTYCCLVCDFFLHESCLRLFPPQLQLQLPLQSFNITLVDGNNLSCFACGIRFRKYDLCYSCDLNLLLHPTCARTIVLTLPLAYEAHDHALYYFGRDFQIMFRAIGHDGSCSFNWFKCNTCHEYCTRSFYRCLEDKINFHLECVPIPQVVKSKCHRHHLELKDSFFVEGYDYDDQYCDVCEEKRDPKNHVYICEECVYPIVGHIECVLFKMERIIAATPGASTNPAGCNELDLDNSKIIRDQPLKLVIEKNFVQTFEDEVLSVDLHPTKPWILVGFKENVCIWNYQSKKKEMSCDTTANLPQSSIVDLLLLELSVKFVASENWIVIGAQDGFIYIYNYEMSNFIHEFEAHTNQILNMFVHPSHPYVLSTSRDGLIRLWNWEKGWDCMQEFIGHREEDLTNEVFIPRDHNTFASASVNGTILIWNFDSPHPIRGFRVCDQLNYIDLFMAGAELYLLTHQNGINSIEVWDYKTKTCVQTLGGHDEVTAISAHPEFPIIFTSWRDTIDIWNSANYRLQKTLEFPELEAGGIHSIRCMEGSSYVAFAGYYGIAVIKITYSKDHNVINFQVDEEKKEERGSGKEIIK